MTSTPNEAALVQAHEIAQTAPDRIAACGRITDPMLDLGRLNAVPYVQMIVPDDAMAPTISAGWAVFGSPNPPIEAGRLYLIQASSLCYVRRLGFEANGGSTWLADNPAFAAVYLPPGDVEGIWSIEGMFWSCHGFEVIDWRLIARKSKRGSL
jgi:hypothetical protein